MMATETEPTPAEIIAAADDEITASEVLAVELENRVREGDESVTFDQVERARGLKRFAQLRREAAEKKAARLAGENAAAELDALLDAHVPGAVARDAKVDALLTQARELIDQALTVAEEADRHVLTLAGRAKDQGNPYHPEGNAELIGEKFGEFSWFEARGNRVDILTAGGVIMQLIEPYRSKISGLGRYSDLKSAIKF